MPPDRLIDDEISCCQATAVYAKASEQDRIEAAKVWSWVQERLLNCSRNLAKQHFVKSGEWVTVGPGGSGSIEAHWFDLIHDTKGHVLQRVEAACLFWMRRNRVYQKGRLGSDLLHEVLGDYCPQDDHRRMMGIYLIDILGFRVSRRPRISNLLNCADQYL
jgi:hypothetical protein